MRYDEASVMLFLSGILLFGLLSLLGRLLCSLFCGLLLFGLLSELLDLFDVGLLEQGLKSLAAHDALANDMQTALGLPLGKQRVGVFSTAVLEFVEDVLVGHFDAGVTSPCVKSEVLFDVVDSLKLDVFLEVLGSDVLGLEVCVKRRALVLQLGEERLDRKSVV